jgi:hypothetical protein
MSKLDREAQIRRGEALLRDWGIPDDADAAALHALIGRDPSADLAIAARLGNQVTPASIDVLTALEAGTADKLLRKEVHRSRYRLEQRGIAIPRPTPSPPPAPPPALEGYVSAVDGRGDQLVWLLKPRPGGIAHLFAVLNDPDGLREVDLSETTRKALRAARQELLARHELRMVEADWRYCDFLIDRALRWAAEQGHPVSGDYRGFRAQLIKEPVAAMPPLILSKLDGDAVRRDTQLVVTSDTLLTEPEFRTWFFDAETLKPYIEEFQQIRDSPLVLSPVQQQERFRALVERAVEELFGGARRDSWVRRLQEMAYFFFATARAEQSKRALAAACALEAGDRGGRDIPLCEVLARRSLAAFLEVEEQRVQEETRGSLVLTPQQAAREAQRRSR